MRLPAVALLLALSATVSAFATRQDRFAARPDRGAPQTAGALAIVVHRSNPTDNLSLRELQRIFLLERQTWGHGRKITLVLRESGQPERSEAIRLICGMSDSDYDRHVLLQTFRGTISQGPREIRTAPAMVRFIFNAPGAIGYVTADTDTSSIKVLRINGLLPDDPNYPLRRRAASREN